MAYQGREPRYQQPPSQYSGRSDNYTRQHNDYRQAQYNDRAYTQNQYDQQWQQQPPQHEPYANTQPYSQAYEYEQDGRYAQDANGHHDQRYAQQQYQEEYVAQPQQVRQYQYDDRYREDSRAAQSQTRVGGQAASGRRSPHSQPRPGTSASDRMLKQDRILDKAESPQTLAWDNPFGVFPGSKKDVDNKKKEADESRSQSRADTPAGRPSTSASNRKPVPAHSKQSLEEPRPQASNRQQQQPTNAPRQSYDQPFSRPEEMPLRKNPPAEYHEDYAQFAPPVTQPSRSYDQALPMRPAVQRANTGPLPAVSPITPDVRSMPQNIGRSSAENQPVHTSRPNDAHAGFAEGSYDNSYDQRLPEQRYRQVDGTAYARPPNSGSSSSRDRPPPNAYASGHPSQNSYQSNQALPSSNNISDHRLSDRVPNFQVNHPNAGNTIDRELSLQTGSGGQEPRPQIYRKPTYGDMHSRSPPVRSGLASPTSAYPDDPSSVSSPTGGFDFGLPSTEPSSAQTPRNERPRRVSQEQGYPVQQQFPPRNGSRQPPPTQRPTNGFSHPYNQPPRRQEPVPRPQTANASSRGPPPPRQEYGFDNQGFPQQYSRNDRPARSNQYNNDANQWNEPQGNRQLARTYTEPVGPPGDERYNHGYEQRQAFEPPQNYPTDRYATVQPRADSLRPSQEPGFGRTYETPPPRPRTANSSRPPHQQYPNQPMPDLRQPHADYAIADRNHPVPVRPGLMQQPPVPIASPAPVPAPPAQQVSPPRNLPSSSQHTRRPSEAPSQKPVTIQELNDLRNAVKARPDDNELGLKFAKRLVEASSVLASEGGRADPKTAAKNRERYINDAYRIVKKLVSNGSAEAMFYLADCYGQGSLGLEVNPKEAFQLYTSAAKLGHAQSTYRVAVCCELGPDGGGGTRRDHFKAVQFYKKAATLGDGPAMFKMGMILLKGLLGAQPNRREGISWLKRAAERADEDNPHALHELASLYENAQSTDVIIRDERYALQLYTEAANLGYKYAQWRLGSAYEYGTLGVQIDPRQSIGWYTRAAAQGEHQSEFALSGWYLTGSEPLLAQSDQEAYLWARKAASNGLSKAEYAMGYYTEVGIGCRSDIEEAKKWYFRAAAQNDSRAKERLEEIKRGGARKEKTRISRTNVGKQNEGECSVM